jgi:hypothetical protein
VCDNRAHTATRPVYVVLFTHIEDNSAEPSSPDRVGGTALQGAYAAGGMAPVTFTNPAPTAGVTTISTAHLTEIRVAVLVII